MAGGDSTHAPQQATIGVEHALLEQRVKGGADQRCHDSDAGSAGLNNPSTTRPDDESLRRFPANGPSCAGRRGLNEPSTICAVLTDR